MNFEKAVEMADSRRAIYEAPTSNPVFETLTDKHKIEELGVRISRITNEGSFSRIFDGRFVSDGGIEVNLRISALYTNSQVEHSPGCAFQIAATWEAEDTVLMTEIAGEGMYRDDSPEEVTNTLNRLEESVSAAEVLHAQRSVE